LTQYQNKFAKQINLKLLEEKTPNDFQEYLQVKEEIFELMKKADILANKLRQNILA